MKSIIISFLCLTWTSVNTQQIDMIWSFLSAVSKEKESFENLKEEFLEITEIEDQEKNENWQKMIDILLLEMHDRLGDFSTSELIITNQKNEPEMFEDLIIPNGEEYHVYSVVLREQQLTYILMKKNKITSFSTMQKGDKKVFVTL